LNGVTGIMLRGVSVLASLSKPPFQS
jgi:hypothetical protein